MATAALHRVFAKDKTPSTGMSSVSETQPSLESDSSNATTTAISPVQLLKALFARHNASARTPSTSSRHNSGSNEFQRPSPTELEAYDLETCRAVRAGDIEAIKRLHQQGKSLNGCNPFGESLLHMACRRGDKTVVQFLIEQAQVRTDVKDDMGRNALHDCCWTSQPNTEVMDLLIRVVSPELLLAQDVRGHTPFDYARRAHWGTWNKFLSDRQDVLERRLSIASSIAHQ